MTRGKEYFEELMKKENEKEQRVDEVTIVKNEVQKFTKAEVRRKQ